MRWPLLAIASSVLGANAEAQNGLYFTVSNHITPESPETVLTAWAAWDIDYYAFARAEFSVFASSDPGGFASVDGVPGFYGKRGGVSDDGDTISSIDLTQFFFPGNVWPDKSNPIAFWTAHWTTKDFLPRFVDLRTLTTGFRLYDEHADWFDVHSDGFAEAIGAIRIVPPPASGITLLFLAAPTLRRCVV